jgi:hypothetical protein
MKPTRRTAFKLWLACTLVLPALWFMQLMQGLFGSPTRSINMAVALDQQGNALFGGDPRMTISERAGLAQMDGKRWARLAVPLIDALFGAGHCADEAADYLKNQGLKGQGNG